jgi:heme/copper-type cytochrome/quinol oxidase subunit 1
MGIGASIFLIAVGAILAFAVHVTASGLDLNTIGVILMVVGVIGLATSLLLLNGGVGGWYGGPPRRRTIVEDAVVEEPVVPVTRRRVVRRRNVI